MIIELYQDDHTTDKIKFSLHIHYVAQLYNIVVSICLAYLSSYHVRMNLVKYENEFVNLEISKNVRIHNFPKSQKRQKNHLMEQRAKNVDTVYVESY